MKDRLKNLLSSEQKTDVDVFHEKRCGKHRNCCTTFLHYLQLATVYGFSICLGVNSCYSMTVGYGPLSNPLVSYAVVAAGLYGSTLLGFAIDMCKHSFDPKYLRKSEKEQDKENDMSKAFNNNVSATANISTKALLLSGCLGLLGNFIALSANLKETRGL